MKKLSKQAKKIITVTIVILILAAIYLFIPAVRNEVNHIISLFMTLDLEGIKEYILAAGAWGPIISILLMIFQSVLAPLPAFLITFANAWIYGWAWGAVISWTGAMIGAALCFYITRVYGRPVGEKFVGVKALDKTDTFFNRYGKHAVLIVRLIPFISFDIVSYAAGLTSMSFLSFFIATGLGQIPATIIYSYFGQQITSSAKIFLHAFSAIIIIGILVMLFKKTKKEKRNTRRIINE